MYFWWLDQIVFVVIIDNFLFALHIFINLFIFWRLFVELILLLRFLFFFLFGLFLIPLIFLDHHILILLLYLLIYLVEFLAWWLLLFLFFRIWDGLGFLFNLFIVWHFFLAFLRSSSWFLVLSSGRALCIVLFVFRGSEIFLLLRLCALFSLWRLLLRFCLFFAISNLSDLSCGLDVLLF